MNKIIFQNNQPKQPSVKEILDEAKVGQAFLATQGSRNTIAMKATYGYETFYLLDLIDGKAYVSIQYITSLTPIDIEIREL